MSNGRLQTRYFLIKFVAPTNSLCVLWEWYDIQEALQLETVIPNKKIILFFDSQPFFECFMISGRSCMVVA